MEIVNEKPPVWEECLKFFPTIENHPVVFAWGDKLYNPNNANVTEDLIAHERVHSHQQNDISGGVEAWWKKYLLEPQFRLEQEIEAYQVQYYFQSNRLKDRNKLYRELHRYASVLSSPLYGNVITLSEAERLIKNV
jgi:hypothetical protein